MDIRLLLCCCLCCFTVTIRGQQAHLAVDNVANVMPSRADSNSPAFWRDGRLNIVNSTGRPVLTKGSDQLHMYLGSPKEVHVDIEDHFPMWIEAVWQDEDGTVYAWYHHEPGDICPGSSLTTPRIGALVSMDGGATFTDLGIVLASGDPADCSAQNGFFAGGHGDFSVIPDQDRRYFYFLFGNYGGDIAGQGVAIARMAFEDRSSPVDKVWKYHEGAWEEPGLEGRESSCEAELAAPPGHIAHRHRCRKWNSLVALANPLRRAPPYPRFSSCVITRRWGEYSRRSSSSTAAVLSTAIVDDDDFVVDGVAPQRLEGSGEQRRQRRRVVIGWEEHADPTRENKRVLVSQRRPMATRRPIGHFSRYTCYEKRLARGCHAHGDLSRTNRPAA